LVRREALVAMADGQPRLVKIAPDEAADYQPGVVSHLSTCPSAGKLDVFIDPQLPRPLLLVVGGTPAAHTLIKLGATIGYSTCAVHPGAVAADFPDANLVIDSLDLGPARPPPAEIAAERHAHERRYAIPVPETATDPISGMQVEVTGALHTLTLGETTHYFCGAGCLDTFRRTPSPTLPARGRE